MLASCGVISSLASPFSPSALRSIANPSPVKGYALHQKLNDAGVLIMEKLGPEVEDTGEDILERTQKGNLDMTRWMFWFLGCLHRTIDGGQDILSSVTFKAKFWERDLPRRWHFGSSFRSEGNSSCRQDLANTRVRAHGDRSGYG